uniref:Uncharacterized protein n=1 Tax=Cacopsylla melanoneura TaxID=428564 RepID=A0A8D8TFD1_9HEMI
MATYYNSPHCTKNMSKYPCDSGCLSQFYSSDGNTNMKFDANEAFLKSPCICFQRNYETSKIYAVHGFDYLFLTFTYQTMHLCTDGYSTQLVADNYHTLID